MARPERSRVIATKVTADDEAAIKEAAEAEGLSVSDYVRSATLAYMALSGRPYGLKALGRGALRIGAQAAEAVLREARERGWEKLMRGPR